MHCYRILGSVQDAEDVLQETLLAAWRGLSGFEGRSSVRTWLYRIATNRCLNALRDGPAGRGTAYQPAEVPLPAPTRRGDPSWLEPYPDVLLDGLPDHAPGPGRAATRLKESVSLAFVTAPADAAAPAAGRAGAPRRARLTGPPRWPAMLEITEDSVTSALKRARAALAADQLPGPGRDQAPLPDSARERKLVERLRRGVREPATWPPSSPCSPTTRG